MDGGRSKVAGDFPRLGTFRPASNMEVGSQRFLACAIAHALACGRRSAMDLLRHFPPSALMRGLEHNVELRAVILTSTTGMRERIALRKTWEEAAADLRLAFDEGETTAEAIVELLTADALVSHLDAQKLWRFLTEGEFWKAVPANEATASVLREHVAYLLDAALQEELLDHRDMMEGLTVPALSSWLPRENLGALIQRALENGSQRRNFTAVDLIEGTTTAILVKWLPLSEIWNSVIRPRVARRHGFEVSSEQKAWSLPPPPAALPDESTVPVQGEFEEITNVLPIATLASMVDAARR
jgi:hypothetical protein